MKQIPDAIYNIAALSVVMSGKKFANDDQSEPDFVMARIKIKRNIYEEIKKEGLDINVVVGRLLENFLVAYKSLWDRIEEISCSGRDLNPGHRLERLSGFSIRYLDVKEEFKRWLYSRIEASTATYYINYLDKYANCEITSPEELHKILSEIKAKGVRRWTAKAFRNLLNFYGTVKGVDSYILDKFRKVCVIEQADTRDVFVSDEEIVEAHKSMQNGKAKLIFELLVYSGIRLIQALEMLAEFDPNNLIIVEEKGIARYPIVSTSKGNKRGFFAYMPLDFARQLSRTKISYSHAKEIIKHNRVTANSIRKWHYNFLIMHGVPPEIADFIQGRRPASVGAMHYLAKATQADEFYSKVVDKFPIKEG